MTSKRCSQWSERLRITMRTTHILLVATTNTCFYIFRLLGAVYELYVLDIKQNLIS